MFHDLSTMIISISPFILTGVVVVAVLYFRFARRLETEKTIRAAIDRGQELSPELIERLLAPQRSSHRPDRLKVWGVVLIFTGLGLAAMWGVTFLTGGDFPDVLAPAVLVGLIGVGLWVAARLTKSDQPQG